MTTVFWSPSVVYYVSNMANTLPEKTELDVICGVVYSSRQYFFNSVDIFLFLHSTVC